MNRQEQFVNLIPAYENASGIYPFQGTITTDYKYKVWNMQSVWEPEFYGSVTDESLSGKKRSNFRGYRLKSTIVLDNSTESSGIRTLFNKLSGGFDRLVWQTIFSATSGPATTFTIASPVPSANSWLIGTTASGMNSSVESVVTSFVTGTATVTVADSVSVTDANAVYFYAKPNIETIILFDLTGGATAHTDATLIPCNVIANNYGSSRESTINQQRVGIELESVELYKDIPSQFLIT
jgi:hypothetical protein